VFFVNLPTLSALQSVAFADSASDRQLKLERSQCACRKSEKRQPFCIIEFGTTLQQFRPQKSLVFAADARCTHQGLMNLRALLPVPVYCPWAAAIDVNGLLGPRSNRNIRLELINNCTRYGVPSVKHPLVRQPRRRRKSKPSELQTK
jgi:hypothetical protein